MRVRASVIVATPDLAHEISGGLVGHAPHFHCGGVDAGTVADLYCLLSSNPNAYREAGSATRILHSKSTRSKSVYVFLLPTFVVERFGAVAESEVPSFAVSWAQARGLIRFARAANYYQDLIRGVSRLARLALQNKQSLLLRVEYAGAYNLLLQPTR